MPHEPKRRHSRQRKGKRRASITNTAQEHVTCQNCGAPVIAHRVCKKCGFYKGKSILKVKEKAKVTTRSLKKTEEET